MANKRFVARKGLILQPYSGITEAQILISDSFGEVITGATFTNLTDVSVSSASQGQGILYSGGTWVPYTPDDQNNYLTGVVGTGNFSAVTFTRLGLSDITWDSRHNHNDLYVSISGDTMIGSLIINESTGYALEVNGNTIMRGDLFVSGTTTTIYTQNMNVKDNIIMVNSGETGAGISAPSKAAGIGVDRGSETDFYFLFDDTRDLFVVGSMTGETLGDVATLQAVATRENTPNDTSIAFWNDADNRFDTSDKLYWDGNELNVTGDFKVTRYSEFGDTISYIGDARKYKSIFKTGYDMYGNSGTYNGTGCGAAGTSLISSMYIVKSFDDVVEEAVVCTLSLPTDYEAGTQLRVELSVCTTSTSGGADMVVGLQSVSDGDGFDGITGTLEYVDGLFTAPGTAFEKDTIDYVFSGTTFDVGDDVGVVIYRETTNPGDTLTGDMFVSSIKLKYISNNRGENI